MNRRIGQLYKKSQGTQPLGEISQNTPKFNPKNNYFDETKTNITNPGKSTSDNIDSSDSIQIQHKLIKLVSFNEIGIDSFSSQFDSLAKYEKKQSCEDDIIKKLTCLKNIFKQLKYIREIERSRTVKNQISSIENELLSMEKDIINIETSF